MEKEVLRNTIQKEELSPSDRFDQRNEISKLKLFVVIVSRGQADAIIARLQEAEVSASFVVSGQGTAVSELYDLIGPVEAKKQIVFAVVKEENTEKVVSSLEQRFKISKAASGVAFSIKITSLVGVSIYKFLSNTRLVKEKKNVRKK